MRIDRRVAIAGAFIVAAAAMAWACGPFFPTQLLDDRSGTLKATPANSFAWETAHLVKPADALKANEISPWARQGADPAEPTPEERAGLTPEQVAKVRAMRQARDGDTAYAAGEGLPAAVRLYTTGAVIYRAADPWCGPREPDPDNYGEPAPAPAPCDRDLSGDLAKAASRFHAILDLPANEGAIRSVWAAYMLGQIHAALAIASPSDLDAARKAFALARQRAVAGDPDPAGLAVASYGEEARLYLTAGGCHWSDFYDKAGCIPRMDPADVKRMAGLYTEQAARGSQIGVISLAMISNWALRDPARARVMAEDPLMRRLMVSYALARLDDTIQVDPDSGAGYTVEAQAKGVSGVTDAARGVPQVSADLRLVTLVQIIESQPATDGADRLAALSYRAGRYDLAARFAAAADTPMAEWVKAKLALRAGDLKGAAAAYARAAKAFPEAEGLEPESARLVKGEQGVLSLAQGEYAEALLALFQAATVAKPATISVSYAEEPGYAEDASYIAERVLTTDELKRFVDVNAAATPAPKAPPKDDEYWSNPPAPLGDRLRYLLARRMVREGRHTEALAYFPEPADPRFADPAVREHARQYGEALDAAEGAWTDVGRAQALYTAAAIARRNGMEIMGYEQGPDWTDNNGTFGWGSGRETPDWSYPPAPPPPTPQARAAKDLPGPFVTDDERKRYAVSEARPLRRFHYRYVAMEQAEQAAGLLPARSQAFAAVLCHAAGWIGHGEEQASDLKRVYRRYLKEGAYVPWAAQFGQECPEPEFDRARWFTLWRAYAWSETRLRHRWYVPVAGVILLAGLGAAFINRRRNARGGEPA